VGRRSHVVEHSLPPPSAYGQGRSLERLGQLDQPLNRRNERAALRSLSGVAAFTLSRFTTTLEDDEQVLLSGTYRKPVQAPVAGQQQQQQQATFDSASVSEPGVPLTDDMRLAIRFRMEKKKVLSAAIQAMGRQLQALSKASVPEQSTAPRKGQAPPAATEKGFGKKSK
jgi:hypothetical protein